LLEQGILLLQCVACAVERGLSGRHDGGDILHVNCGTRERLSVDVGKAHIGEGGLEELRTA